MEHILVTGGAGYVGSALVPTLIEKGFQVTVMDWFFFEPNVFREPIPNLSCVVADLRDCQRMREVLEGVDAVIHLAGISNDPSCDLDPKTAWEINMEATWEFAKLADAIGVKRFINASSATVYGVCRECDVTEQLELDPLTTYARSKAESELKILSLNRHDFITSSIRPATLSGFAPRMRLDLVANIFAYHAIHYGRIRIFGGSQWRPNLSVRDMVSAYVQFLEADGLVIGGQAFNVCEGNYTLLQVAETVQRVVGPEQTELMVVPTDDLRSYRLCADRVAREIGFRPKDSLEDSIATVVDALQKSIIEPQHIRYRNADWMKAHGVPSLGNPLPSRL